MHGLNGTFCSTHSLLVVNTFSFLCFPIELSESTGCNGVLRHSKAKTIQKVTGRFCSYFFHLVLGSTRNFLSTFFPFSEVSDVRELLSLGRKRTKSFSKHEFDVDYLGKQTICFSNNDACCTITNQSILVRTSASFRKGYSAIHKLFWRGSGTIRLLIQPLLKTLLLNFFFASIFVMTSILKPLLEIIPSICKLLK